MINRCIFCKIRFSTKVNIYICKFCNTREKRRQRDIEEQNTIKQKFIKIIRDILSYKIIKELSKRKPVLVKKKRKKIKKVKKVKIIKEKIIKPILIKKEVKPKIKCKYCSKPLVNKEDIASGFHRGSYKEQMLNNKQPIPKDFDSVRR